MLSTVVGLRSARGRAALATAGLILVLVAVALVAVIRVREHQKQLLALENTAGSVAALEHGRAQLSLELGSISGLVLTGDGTLLDAYNQAAVTVEQDLIQARAEAAAAGDASYVATLDNLTERVGSFNQGMNAAIPVLLEADAETKDQFVSVAMPGMWAEASAIVGSLDEVAQAEQADLAAERATSHNAAAFTSWIIVGFGGIALLVATGVVVATIASVIGPLVSLRASARAITSGDLKSRAKVSGPEEVASVARDFNEMADALAAKTEEYVAITNLTGDIIVKTDKHGTWTFVNDAACQFYGKPREELLQATFPDYVHPEDLALTAQRIRQAVVSMEPIRGLVTRQTTPMGTRVVEWNGSLLFDEDGRYAGIQVTGRDITERKQMEDALAAKTEEYVAVTNLTCDIIGKIDTEGRWVFLNDAACQFFGKPREELLGSDSKACIHPEDVAPSVQAVRKAAATGEPIDGFVNRQVTPKGTRVVEWNASPFFDEEGRYAGIQMTGRDITERKKAEEELAASEERLKILFEFAPDAYYLNDLEAKFVDGNKVAEELIGYSKEEVTGKSFLDLNLLPPDQVPKAAAMLAKNVQGLPTGPDELTLIRRDGSRVPVEIRTFPVRIREQTLVLGIARDITERKKAEGALRESEERFRSLSTSAPIGIFLTDVQGKCTYANPRLLEIAGLTSEESLGYGWVKVIHPDDRQAILEEANKAAGQGRDLSYDIRIVTPKGQLHWAHIHTSPTFSTEGEVIGRVGAVEDINERKRAEEALAAKTKEYIDTLNLTGDMIIKLDQDGKLIFVNDAACQSLGRSRDEVLGADAKDIIHPDDLERATQAVEEVIESKGQVKAFESRIVTPIGTRIVEWNAQLFFDEEGEFGGIQITGRDATERKKGEEALRESEERYRLITENVSDVIWTADLDRRYTYVSPSVTAMRGYTPEELIGTKQSDIMSDAYNGFFEKVLAADLAGLSKRAGRPLRARTFEVELDCKDGSTIWAEVRAVLIRDSNGRPIGIQGITRDTTERKRMEEALRESEARYRLLTENTSDLIWTMDLNLRYTYMSPAIKRMRGYTAEEIMDAPITETMTPASVEVARKTLAEELVIERMGGADPNRTTKVELEMYCRDGSTIWTEMNMVWLRDADGKPVGILGVTRDISERKRAEEERERLHAELELRAITDSLTGLYDHAHFYQRLAEEIDRSKRYKHGFAVVMMDVDDFKRFNDSRGHQAGDEMLRLVAECIRAGVRRSDIAFRYGGDEFAAILPHAGASKARAAVARINGRITQRVKRMDGEAAARLSLSAGVACFPDDGRTTDDLVRVADAALYSAKWVARARDIMGQREDIQSLISALVGRRAGAEGAASGAIFRPEALHEQQARIVASVASSIAVALRDAGVAKALEDPDLQVLATVGAAAEIKDRYIRGHPERTSEQATALAKELGLSSERTRDIQVAGLLHDIGKVTVSEGILNKPGKLTRREFDSIKDHPIVGATLVSQVKGFERLVPIVRHHHERFDGNGYPDGLAGEEIPLEARILSVVDVFDALTHQRSYRKALNREETITELRRGAGAQFDPAVVEAFLTLLKRRGDGLGPSAHEEGEERQRAAARVPERGKG
jgi:diguanylate cyclase (GGDEF)-like protein/PAS domain S-box-containing protein/putative nucleotidyltransferase with HDIG domain